MYNKNHNTCQNLYHTTYQPSDWYWSHRLMELDADFAMSYSLFIWMFCTVQIHYEIGLNCTCIIYICVKSNASLHDINWLIHLNKICLTSSEVFYTLISFTYFSVMPNFLRCTGSMYRDHLYSPVQASIYEADVASICPLLTFCDCSVPWDIGHSWPQNKSDPPHSSPHVCLGCSQIQIHAYKCRLAVHNYNSCIYI